MVDGASAAKAFLEREMAGKESGEEGWDNQRLQLIWDAIALHTSLSFARHKEPEVVATSLGTSADFQGPGELLTQEEYGAVARELPRLGFKDENQGCIVWVV